MARRPFQLEDAARDRIASAIGLVLEKGQPCAVRSGRRIFARRLGSIRSDFARVKAVALIETASRAQIVQAAIDTIAEVSSQRLSLASARKSGSASG